MTPITVFLAAVGVSCAPVPPPAAKPERDMAALEKKPLGEWSGQGPCVGGLTLGADGTFKRTLHGPGGNNSAGTWAVRWDALPPTLVLTCTTSDSPAYLRKTEVKLVRLDDGGLAFTHPDSPKPARETCFSRVKK